MQKLSVQKFSPPAPGSALFDGASLPRDRANAIASLCEIVERSPSNEERHDAIIRIDSRDVLEQRCATASGRERLLMTLQLACSDPYWRVRNNASSALRLMMDLDLLHPQRLIGMIESGSFFKDPHLTAFPNLDSDLRFAQEAVPLNRDWTARANLRAAGLWAWAEASPLLNSPASGKFGFLKLYPPGSSAPFPVEEIGGRDPFGLPSRHDMAGLFRQYLSFSLQNPGAYTRNRRYVDTGIAMLILGRGNAIRPLDAGDLDALSEALAPRRQH